MKLLPSLSFALLALSAPTFVSAQAAPKEKLELSPGDEKPKVNLDPTGKLPSANKDDALVPLDAGSAATSQELPAALKKLSNDQRLKYANLRDEATNYMRSVRLQESLEKLAEAERVVGDTLAEIENLRGAVYTKMRDFPTARIHFGNASAQDKDSFHPKFNLAELDFVEKKWDAALSSFTKLIAENEAMKKTATAKLKDEAREAVSKQFDTTTHLMQFKIMICQVQQKKEAEAQATFKNFNEFDNDSPAYYFGKAVFDFANDKKDKAEDWVASAKGIYPAEMTEVYVDSLVEMGWLQTLQQ